MKKEFTIAFLTMFLLLNVLGLPFNTFVALGSTVRKVPEQYPTIQAAINAADPGDIIQVAAGIYYEHIVVNKPVKLRGDNRTSIIDGQLLSPMILNVTVGNVEISGFTIQNGGPNQGGIWVGSWTYPIPIKTGVNVTDNALINNGVCVYFSYCTNSTITNNIMQSSTYGVMLHHSDYNTVIGNKIEGMRSQAMEIYAQSTNNNFTSNIVTKNKYGILLEWSNNNLVNLNNIASNTEYGIRLSYSTNVLIKENTIEKNKYGVYVWNCSRNTFYHNNFIENTAQADKYAADLTRNLWDTNVRPGTEGNYWSDYTGVDDGSGTGRWGETRKAGDGVGDTKIPHSRVAEVSWYWLDWYPLMHPWTPRPSIKPYAIFTYYPPQPVANITTTFNASQSYDRDGNITSYMWNFGDGTPPVTEPDPITTHVFTMGGNYTVTLTVTDNDGNTNSTSKLIEVLPYLLVIDLYTQKEPYSGRGPNQPSDAFAPQERVFLYAEVTYNYDPVQNKPVAFVVTDPIGGILIDRSNYTNSKGITEINFALPTDTIFGIYTAVASVSVAEKNASDTLTFEVGWIIEIINVKTVDDHGTPKIIFAKGENVYFNVRVKNIAFTSKTAILTITILDDCGVPIGAVGLSIAVAPGTQDFNLILNVEIPEWSLVGTATAVACAFTNWPWTGGDPYCPEVSIQFALTSG